MNNPFDREVSLKLLRLLHENPKLTQREMNQQMRVSLGKINYCVAALVQKGAIKIERFKKSKHKSAYMYRLTPEGIEELANLTVEFLKIKVEEYDKIKAEIKTLSKQIENFDHEICDDTKSVQQLKNKIDF